MKPEILEIMERLADWCIRRAEAGDVTTDALVDNLANTVKTKIIPARKPKVH